MLPPGTELLIVVWKTIVTDLPMGNVPTLTTGAANALMTAITATAATHLEIEIVFMLLGSFCGLRHCVDWTRNQRDSGGCTSGAAGLRRCNLGVRIRMATKIHELCGRRCPLDVEV